MEKIIAWKKGTKLALSKHFDADEFDCSCQHAECVWQHLSEELVDRLERVREEVNMPLWINSACRCHQKQEDLKAAGYETAVGRSPHEMDEKAPCRAADVRCADMAKLEAACKKHFMAVGTAKSFIHVDLRSDKVRRWGYVRS
jgi:hypothetical protein